MVNFRVWDNQAKCYEHDREFVIGSNGELIELVPDHKGKWKWYSADTDRFVVEYGTGLEDFSGEQIYQNDIVDFMGFVLEVVWDKEKACFDLELDGIRNMFNFNKSSACDMQVIKTIHEEKR